jgi:uncharacterized membrane protein YcaP (DUF421 family)
MASDWFLADSFEIGMVVVSSIVTYGAILLYTRLAGLRSFSKMSAADYAMTVAVGSLFASTISAAKPALIVGLVALGMLFAGQWLLSVGRTRWDWFSKAIDNEPVLLMQGDEILDSNLQRVNVSRADLYCKLREANAFDRSQVLAVVFETTGDISVLHSADPDARIDPLLMTGVIGADSLRTASDVA